MFVLVSSSRRYIKKVDEETLEYTTTLYRKEAMKFYDQIEASLFAYLNELDKFNVELY